MPVETSKPVSWHANIEQAAVALREKCLAEKCYTDDQKVLVETVLRAIAESNAMIKQAIQDAVLIQAK